MLEIDFDQLAKQTENLSLLYVEDDANARNSTFMMLNELLEDITVASNGQEGLDLFKQKQFDLVLTDINMPIMSGIEMLQEIRKIDPDIAVIILSAYNESEYLLKTISLQVDGYILKPIDLDHLLNVLNKTINQLAIKKENRAYKANLEDEIEKKKSELVYLHSHDQVTELPNFIQLDEALRKEQFNYLILLDVSDFSLIVKEYGYHFAQKSLHAIAKHLQNQFSNDHFRLFKVESDRYVILSSEANKESIIEFLEQIQAYFDQTLLNIDDAELSISFTIGVADININPNALIDAEYALDNCKAVGSRFYSFAEHDLEKQRHERDMIKWLKITKVMISKDMIFPYFQPIKDIKNNKIMKYEVLARGEFLGEIIPPFRFLGAAEHLGLLSSITKMIIHKSFEFFQHSDYSFSINISERDLLEDYLVEYLSIKAKTFGIDPSRVTLEVLENITTKSGSEIITRQLNGLKKVGYRIAIDDFGVENSNFSRLLDIDIDLIKLDGLFIKNITSNEKDRKIVQAIVSLAKALGIQTVAEFVETEEIYDLLMELDIDFAQGYHIGKPRNDTI